MSDGMNPAAGNPATNQQAAPAPKGAAYWNSDDFEDMLKQAGDQPVLVDFYAEWCGPCKLAAPIIDKLADEFRGKVVIAKVDTDDNNDLAAKYGIMSIPTVVVFKNSEEIDRKIGFPGEMGYRQMLSKATPASTGAAA